LHSINLVATNPWRDLFTGAQYEDLNDMLEMQPYQCIWLTNKWIYPELV
jgi:sucrose phosphorylase